MAKYVFTCEDCGEFEIECSMKEISDKVVTCKCGKISRRIYSAIPNMWLTDGAYSKENHNKKRQR